MSLSEFKKSIQEASNSLNQALSSRVNFEEDQKQSHLLDYKGIQKEYYKRIYYQMIDRLEQGNRSIQELAGLGEENVRILGVISTLIEDLKQTKSPGQMREIIDDLASYADKLKESSSVKIGLNKDKIPEEIRGELVSDIQELGRCFNAGCYRSAIILCGRILETALHRVYFERTQNDLLEKSPGIGIGNLIAKIKEQGIDLDPALSNQVHLINQVRIFSVHRKQSAFEPSKTQAHAIILYTIDVIDKLFR